MAEDVDDEEDEDDDEDEEEDDEVVVVIMVVVVSELIELIPESLSPLMMPVFVVAFIGLILAIVD